MIPFRILRSAKLYDLFLICLDHLLSIPTSIFWWAAEKRAHIATERETALIELIAKKGGLR